MKRRPIVSNTRRNQRYVRDKHSVQWGQKWREIGNGPGLAMNKKSACIGFWGGEQCQGFDIGYLGGGGHVSLMVERLSRAGLATYC